MMLGVEDLNVDMLQECKVFHFGNLAKEQTIYGITKCDVLKISDNEIQWLTGKEDFTEGVQAIREIHNVPLILVSMGGDGSRAYYKDTMVEVKLSFRKIPLRQPVQEILSAQT